MGDASGGLPQLVETSCAALYRYMEIAEILEMPIGTVMSRLSCGKAQLRTLLAARTQGESMIPLPLQTVRS